MSNYIPPSPQSGALLSISNAKLKSSNANYSLPCTINTCFDASRCSKFKVYVYPNHPHFPKSSELYQKIIEAIRRSPFYTPYPEEACIFVPNIDTLDRDPGSPQYVNGLDKYLNKLEYWNFQPSSLYPAQDKRFRSGMNHLLFVLFPGRWPTYDVDDLGMDFGNAMLARTSVSKVRMRKGFDISFPLLISNYSQVCQPSTLPLHEDGRIRRKILTSFKGKRYLFGIGSETRNALYHIHNSRDIIVATTCRHLKTWNFYADSRCEADNVYYETISYNYLLRSSTFCLVPRGRRLGSFRFLEVLEAGCIPVILANDWELPFADVIDWSQAAVVVDERTLSLLPSLLRNFRDSDIIKMREQVRFIWDSYFCSTDAIIQTALMSLRDRLTLRHRNYDLWTRQPGGIVFAETSSIDECAYPFPSLPVRCQDVIHKGFTLIITIRHPFCKDYMIRLKNLASVFVLSRHLKKVIVVWQCSDLLPPSSDSLSKEMFSDLPVSLSFAPMPEVLTSPLSLAPSPSNRFLPTHNDIPTLAVWSVELDINASLELHQVDDAYTLWLQHPHRLIGYTPRTHIWDSKLGVWNYSVEAFTNFSMVLLNAAVYHRYYHALYWSLMTPKIKETIDTLATGEDIFFNCVVGHASQSAPLLLTAAFAKESNELVNYMGASNLDRNQNPFATSALILTYRHTCLRALTNHFNPLFSTVSAILQTHRHFGNINPMNTSFLPLHYSNLRFVSTGTSF